MKLSHHSRLTPSRSSQLALGHVAARQVVLELAVGDGPDRHVVEGALPHPEQAERQQQVPDREPLPREAAERAAGGDLSALSLSNLVETDYESQSAVCWRFVGNLSG